MVKGKIHSIESMGLVDGPGIRTVIFFQGCSLRCSYCHNPDTWKLDGSTEYTAQELVNKVLRYKPYFEKSGGGITCSGGEPLLQKDFLLEFLKLCKLNNINTAIDTAGITSEDCTDILEYVDLVILDIKHYDPIKFKQLTGGSIDKLNKFIYTINKANKDTWVRHVVVPGMTDNDSEMLNLSKFIKSINNVKKVELLPYHTLGVNKYEKLQLNYRLKQVEPMDKDKCNNLQEYLRSIL